jgi:hypothetical protein
MTYIKRQVKVQVSESQNGEGSLFKRGDRETSHGAVTGLEEVGTGKFSITIPATDQDLMEGMGITTGRILYIETDTEITVKLDNTGDTGFKVKPVADASASTKKGTLYLEGTFTHVYVTVAGASGTASVVVGVVGA